MRRCFSFIILFLLCSLTVVSQSLADLEKQLDSLLNKRVKSELILGMGYGNNPAYGSKTINLETPIVMKSFLSPSVGYYHKSGFNASVSSYYLFNTSGNPWFEWDFTVGYDYLKNRHFMAGISYTRYLFADSANVPVTPVTNELFAYFYYRDWWLQPGVSLDLGWGARQEKVDKDHFLHTISGNDFNVVAAVRHPFILGDVVKNDDAVLLTPSVGLTLGSANYLSNLRSFPAGNHIVKTKPAPVLGEPTLDRGETMTGPPKTTPEPRTFDYTRANITGFAVSALDFTLSGSYLIGKFTFSPSYTVFKPFQGSDRSLIGYFTARMAYSIK